MKSLKTKQSLQRLKVYRAEPGERAQEARAAIVRRLAERLELLVVQGESIAREMRGLAARFEPLTRCCGVDWLTASQVAAKLGPG